MRILSDLRTPEYIELERKRNSFNWNKLLFFVLFVAYFGVSGWYLGKTGLSYWKQRERLSQIESVVDNLRIQESDFNAQIEESMSIIDAKRMLLTELETDPAVLNAMLSLTKSSPPDGYLDRVEVESFRNGMPGASLNLKFYVRNESSVVEVNSGLLKDAVFRSLSMPRMSREDPTKIEVRLTGTVEDIATLSGSKPSTRLGLE